MSDQNQKIGDSEKQHLDAKAANTPEAASEVGVIKDKHAQDTHDQAFAVAHRDDKTFSRPEMIAIEAGETVEQYKARVERIQENRFSIDGLDAHEVKALKSKPANSPDVLTREVQSDRSPSHLNLKAIAETDSALKPVFNLREHVLQMPPGPERDELERLARQQEEELLSPEIKALRDEAATEIPRNIIASNIVSEVSAPLAHTESSDQSSEPEEIVAWDGKQMLREIGEATLEQAGFFVHRGREDNFIDYKACQRAWEAAGLDKLGLPKNIIGAIMRNEQHFYKKTDEEQDAQVRKKGTVLSPGGKEDQNVSIGPAQIQIRNIKELIAMTKLDGSMRYPFLEELRADPVRKALAPEYAALLVAALLSDIYTEQKHNGIEKPSPQQIIYGYNPDVHSYSDKSGRHYIPILHLSDANAEKLIHKDLRSERYPLTPSITEASVHVRHVLTQLNLINEAHP